MTDRAVVAISEDRQWLVVHHLGTGRWVVYDSCHWGYQEYTTVEDTGQDAHEVLREWMEGRDVKEDHPSAADETPAGVRADL